MGRQNIWSGGWSYGPLGQPRPTDRFRREWAIVLGERIRRLRRDRDMTLLQISALVQKPEGGNYWPGYFGRIEKGYFGAPLYAYLAVADALEVHPGRLLGPDDVQREATEAETTLLEPSAQRH